jgi:amino acid transporter
VAAAQLAAETRKAARNTANGLLGGILVMAGALIWVAGMAIFGRKGA